MNSELLAIKGKLGELRHEQRELKMGMEYVRFNIRRDLAVTEAIMDIDPEPIELAFEEWQRKRDRYNELNEEIKRLEAEL